MKMKYASVLAATIMVVTAFAVIASADVNEVTMDKPSMYELWSEQRAIEKERGGDPASLTNPEGDGPMITARDGPFPKIDPNGAPQGVVVTPTAWGDNYVSESQYHPPRNPGGGYSWDHNAGLGLFDIGNTNEYFIGDQDGNGMQEWIMYYHDQTKDDDGIDNDGDGCVDEKTFGAYNGQTGCDLVPDGYVYYETGELGGIAGDDGQVFVNSDWYSDGTTEVYHPSLAPWTGAVAFRFYSYFPGGAGGFINYMGRESSIGQNSNPEMDSDLSDQYMGVIDVRGFPARSPTNQLCSAGYKVPQGQIFERDDGSVVVAYELWEYYDGNDWNGDGDTSDYGVAAYLLIDGVTGNCRQGVNIGVFGYYPRTAGSIVSPGYCYESSDGRDWNGDGVMNDYCWYWHNIDARSDLPMSWGLIGPVYTSTTYTAAVPAWGWGYNGLYRSTYAGTSWSFTLKFGAAYMGSYSSGGYDTMFILAAEDDGNPNTLFPNYVAGLGITTATPGGVCIQFGAWESYMYNRGMYLAFGVRGDANGDGDRSDGAIQIFCPDETGGGGESKIEETSKFAKGLYVTPVPWIHYFWGIYYSAAGNFQGTLSAAYWGYEANSATAVGDDADGDLIIGGHLGYCYFHGTWNMYLTKPDFEIIEIGVVSGGATQPGGTIIGKFVLLNVGGMDIKISEDKGIDNDKAFKIQGLSAVDQIGPDGTLIPGEVATFYFALTISAGTGAGILSPTNLNYGEDIEIFVSYGGVVKSAMMTVDLWLKMNGNDLSCYRHKQNALRTIRAFDMDDDDGMLDTAKWAAQMGTAVPERELLTAISWYENGCGLSGQNDVEGAHSYTSSLTGSFGMGMEYWGFAPGQEEGNEGNGNGGLTGNDRKDAYGW
jgi:hypothetical protein